MEELLNVVIEGEEEISLDTLASVLMGTSKSLKKTSNYSRGGNNQEFVVKNIQKGSFIITLGTVASLAASLNIAEIPTALSMFVNFLEIKEHLQGEKPKEVVKNEGDGTVLIVNGDNNVIEVNNYTFNAYTSDQTIDNEITKSMKSLAKDDNVTGLRVENIGDKSEVARFNLDHVSKKTDVISLRSVTKRDISRKIITVTKPDFVKDTKWSGYLDGTIIDFKVNDDKFKSEIEKYNFTKGTKINVDLLSEYQVDNQNKEIKGSKTKYTVLEVIEVINADEEQMNIIVD